MCIHPCCAKKPALTLFCSQLEENKWRSVYL
jgi:hypothetical protein